MTHYGLNDATWRRIEAQAEVSDLERRASGDADREQADREAAEIARLERELELAKLNDAASKLSGEDFGRSIGQTANKNGLA